MLAARRSVPVNLVSTFKFGRVTPPLYGCPRISESCSALLTKPGRLCQVNKDPRRAKAGCQKIIQDVKARRAAAAAKTAGVQPASRQAGAAQELPGEEDAEQQMMDEQHPGRGADGGRQGMGIGADMRGKRGGSGRAPETHPGRCYFWCWSHRVFFSLSLTLALSLLPPPSPSIHPPHLHCLSRSLAICASLPLPSAIETPARCCSSSCALRHCQSVLPRSKLSSVGVLHA